MAVLTIVLIGAFRLQLFPYWEKSGGRKKEHHQIRTFNVGENFHNIVHFNSSRVVSLYGSNFLYLNDLFLESHNIITFQSGSLKSSCMLPSSPFLMSTRNKETQKKKTTDDGGERKKCLKSQQTLFPQLRISAPNCWMESEHLFLHGHSCFVTRIFYERHEV